MTEWVIEALIPADTVGWRGRNTWSRMYSRSWPAFKLAYYTLVTNHTTSRWDYRVRAEWSEEELISIAELRALGMFL